MTSTVYRAPTTSIFFPAADKMNGMKSSVADKNSNERRYVLGKKGFAAISAMEGLKLHRESAERLERNASLSLQERRAETIRAFVATRKRG
jgi:hypothetical protein